MVADKGQMQQQRIHAGVVRGGNGGIVIDLDHHGAGFIGQKSNRHRGIGTALYDKVQMLAIPVAGLGGMFNLIGKMFNSHIV